MNKETKNKIEPKLRFSEFKDKEEWKEISMAKLGELISGLTYSPDDVRDNGLLVLRSSNVQNGKIVLDDNVYVRTDIKGANFSMPNDILICVRNGSKPLIGKNALIQAGMPLSTHGAFMTVFRSPTPSFVFQLFQTDAYDTQVAADLGATINSINGSNFLKYKFFVPTNPEEQQKIASCLSSLDELITSQNKKLEALQAHKKGLTQQLFPADGQTEPKLRFEEFRDSGEWEDIRIDKIIKINSGKGFKASEYSKDGIRLLQIENVGYGSVKWSENAIYLPNNYGLEYSELLLREGDIVLALNRPVTNNELKIARLQKRDEPSILYQRVGKLEILLDSFDNKFVFQICRAFIKDFVLKKSIGSDQPFISLTELYALKLRVPSTREQQKIGDCLSSLDELITAQTEKIEELKRHKKGLVQGLFPNINEITE